MTAINYTAQIFPTINPPEAGEEGFHRLRIDIPVSRGEALRFAAFLDAEGWPYEASDIRIAFGEEAP